jgi:hypothetical protein
MWPVEKMRGRLRHSLAPQGGERVGVRGYPDKCHLTPALSPNFVGGEGEDFYRPTSNTDVPVFDVRCSMFDVRCFHFITDQDNGPQTQEKTDSPNRATCLMVSVLFEHVYWNLYRPGHPVSEW